MESGGLKMFDKILIILALSITFLIVAIIFIINSWGHYGEKKEKYRRENYGGGIFKKRHQRDESANNNKKTVTYGNKNKKRF